MSTEEVTAPTGPTATGPTAPGECWHRVHWFAPDRPVEGNTVYRRPEETSTSTDAEPGEGR